MQIHSVDESVKISSLIELCLQGNRNAFQEIVERHQAMVCALAYSICGDLGRSEELAQDTFIIAWQKLAGLKNPADLKAWLCGIVRNLSYNSLRQQRRIPTTRAEPLSCEIDIGIATPHEQVITKEEEALLWRTLQGIPKAYREPMILFYREDQSTATVAAILGLSEEAVRQRLSRGRTLLSERLARTVENTLRRSAPTKAFTLAVVVALPAIVGTSAKAATAGTVVAKAGLTGKTVPFIVWMNAVWAATLGSFFFLSKAEMANSRTRPREQRFKVNVVRGRVALVVLLGVSGSLLYDRIGSLGVSVMTVFGVNLLYVVTAFRWQDVRLREDNGTEFGSAQPISSGRSLIEVFRTGSQAEIQAARGLICMVALFGVTAAGSEGPARWLMLVTALLLVARLFFRGTGGWAKSQRYSSHRSPVTDWTRRYGQPDALQWRPASGFYVSGGCSLERWLQRLHHPGLRGPGRIGLVGAAARIGKITATVRFGRSSTGLVVPPPLSPSGIVNQ